MKNKIELFQELFSSDPTSKVFYPLAKLYAESGMILQAAETLRQGLSRHPDHMEARLLLIEILHQLERDDAAAEEVEILAGTLSRYPAFWGIWAGMAGQHSPDAAVALNFLSTHLAGEEITWAKVLHKGFEALSGRLGYDDDLDIEAPAQASARPESAFHRSHAPEFTFEAEVSAGVQTRSMTKPIAVDVPDEGRGPSLRTRTMAELLISQGDHAGALEILAELAEHAPGKERIALLSRMEEVHELERQAALKGEAESGLDEADFISGEPMQRAKNKLVRSLSLLAERLEARASV